MIKIVRAASGPLQTAFNRLAENYPTADVTTTIEYGQSWVKVMALETSEGLSNSDALELFTNAFRAEGWGFNAHLNGPMDDMSSEVVGYTFQHPVTVTRTGQRMPAHRPAEMKLVMPLPHRSVPLDTALVTKYAADARNLVIDLLTQQQVREQDEQPARPVPHWARPAASLVTEEPPAPASVPPAPAHTTGLELADEDDQR